MVSVQILASCYLYRLVGPYDCLNYTTVVHKINITSV